MAFSIESGGRSDNGEKHKLITCVITNTMRVLEGQVPDNRPVNGKNDLEPDSDFDLDNTFIY